MTDVNEIITSLRSAPAIMLGTDMESFYWACQKAADYIIRLQQQVDDLKKADSRFIEKRERNRNIYLRIKSGERNSDIAIEYGISRPMVSKICQRERDKERERNR